MSSSVNRPPERGDGTDDPRRPDPADAGGRHVDGQYTDSQRPDGRGTLGERTVDEHPDGRTEDRQGGTDRRNTGADAVVAGRSPSTNDSRRDDLRDLGRRDRPGGVPGGARDATADRDAVRAGTRDRDRDADETRRRPGTTERIVKERTRASRGIARTAAAIVALVFLVVGILGFVPGVTTGVDRLTLAGHDSGALLLGIFQVSVLHNVIHLAFGVVGLLMSRTAGAARTFLIGGGLIYLALWLLGLLFGHDTALNVVPVNDADNWLHLGLGAVMVLLGLLVGRRRVVSREIVD